jgi:hypothetical protein
MEDRLVGGGPIKALKHGHFWKVFILLVLIFGGIRAWHYYKIRHDARIEDSIQQLPVRNTPPINPRAILPSSKPTPIQRQ